MRQIIKLWGIPFLLFMISIFGLIVALVGDGIWNWLGWISLSVPLILATKHYLKK